MKARVFRKKYPASRGGEWAPGWYAAWRDEHGRRRERRAGAKKREAQLFLAEKLRQVEEARRRIEDGQPVAAGDRLLEDEIADYEAVARHQSGFRTKRQQLRSWSEHFRRLLGRPARLKDVTPELVEARLTDLRASGRTTATRNRYLSAIKSLLSRAVERRRLAYNPLACVKQEVEDNVRDRVLSKAERERLLEACRVSRSPELLPLVGLALTTGQRQGRLLRLRWADVDFEARTLTFRPTTASKTKGRACTIPMLDAAREHLLLLPRDGTHVFERGGEPMRFVQLRSAWRGALQRAGLADDVVFHSLRHCFITELAERGVDVRLIQKWVGHRSLTMTMRYTHLRDSGLRDVADLLDGWPDGVREARAGSYRSDIAATSRRPDGRIGLKRA